MDNNEIRSLKRKQALAELRELRTQQASAVVERTEKIITSSWEKERRFFHLVLENTINIILLFDFDGRFAYASDMFLKIAGITNFGLISGRHFHDVLAPIISPDTLARLSEAISSAVAGKNTVSLKEQIVFCSNGKLRTFLIHVTPMVDDGVNTGIMVLFNDITDTVDLLIDLEKRSSELETAVNVLETAQRTVTAIFESNPHMNVMFDSNFKVLDCNPSAFRYMGLETREEFLAGFTEWLTSCIPPFQSHGRPSRSMAEVLNSAVKKGYIKNEIELTIRGKTRIIELELKRIPYGDSYALLGYMMDLTDIREKEREFIRRDELLKKAMEEAQAANRAKSAFFANISHEIRTPMNSIMGFAELALDKAIAPQVKVYLGKIMDSTEWLLRIINDILDISKIESGRMELEKVSFNLNSIFMHCQSVIHSSVTEKGLDLHMYAEPTVGKRLLGDPVRLYQALINLLSNAVKFTSSGTVKLSSAIKDANDHSMTIHFEVKDNGIGMTAEQIEKVFEPFIQADSSTTRNYGGTGLGLAITKSIVELMGGTLSVESAPGAGSTFSFELTFETIDAPDDTPDYNEIVSVEKPEFDGLVLICEDNHMNQQVICEHLSYVGLRTVIAENGKIGFEMVQERIEKNQRPFDMIFMDIYMPVMDGVEAASKISALGVETPIVAMTANVLSSELGNYKNSGMCDCVGKPFTTQELWRCLLKHITPIGVSAVEEADKGRESDLQKKLKVNFVKSNQTKFNEITIAIKAGDMILAHRLAHTLKTNAGLINMTGLQNIAAVVEARLKGGENPNAEQMNSLKSELDSVLEELSALLVEPVVQAEEKSASTEQILALIEKLEPLLKSRDSECVTLLDDIRSIPGSDYLVQQIEKYNFKLAAQVLTELKKAWA